LRENKTTVPPDDRSLFMNEPYHPRQFPPTSATQHHAIRTTKAAECAFASSPSTVLAIVFALCPCRPACSESACPFWFHVVSESCHLVCSFPLSSHAVRGIQCFPDFGCRCHASAGSVAHRSRSRFTLRSALPRVSHARPTRSGVLTVHGRRSFLSASRAAIQSRLRRWRSARFARSQSGSGLSLSSGPTALALCKPRCLADVMHAGRQGHRAFPALTCALAPVGHRYRSG
jgi:hypothetical protein